MPVFHRDFVEAIKGEGRGPILPEHLARVGPRLPVQIGIPEKLASLHADTGVEIPAPTEGYALFDTGASVTCADENILQSLGLEPVNELDLTTPSGSIKAKVYTCALYFPGYPLPDLDPVFVAGAQLRQQGYIALIGRDIMKDMILIYDGPGARVTFAF